MNFLKTPIADTFSIAELTRHSAITDPTHFPYKRHISQTFQKELAAVDAKEEGETLSEGHGLLDELNRAKSDALRRPFHVLTVSRGESQIVKPLRHSRPVRPPIFHVVNDHRLIDLGFHDAFNVRSIASKTR